MPEEAQNAKREVGDEEIVFLPAETVTRGQDLRDLMTEHIGDVKTLQSAQTLVSDILLCNSTKRTRLPTVSFNPDVVILVALQLASMQSRTGHLYPHHTVWIRSDYFST